MASERKIIFECKIGSHLYGTSTVNSDEDYQGVFLPSEQDLLGLARSPRELTSGKKQSLGDRNQAGDIDRKHYAIQRFIELGAEGQPAMLEMLFVPSTLVVSATSEWTEVISCRNAFLSQRGIRPFLGFAQAQANRATLKGKNLNLVLALIEALAPEVAKNARCTVLEFLSISESNQTRSKEKREIPVEANLAGVPVDYLVNEHGFPQICIAGRYFDPTVIAKSLLDSLKTLEERYGNRVREAARSGYDFKSLSHACRLITEAEELLLTGWITLPRPDAEFLLQVKQGFIDREWFDFLTEEIERIDRVVLPQCRLPKEPDMIALQDLCVGLQRRHILGEST
jgi:RNA repair pathway DNA polymerase beta family